MGYNSKERALISQIEMQQKSKLTTILSLIERKKSNFQLRYCVFMDFNRFLPFCASFSKLKRTKLPALAIFSICTKLNKTVFY